MLRSRPGTGKGGKRYNIVHGQLKKAKFTVEEKKSQREKWKKYVGMVQEETEQMLRKDLATTHISCPDCKKTITRRNYAGVCKLGTRSETRLLASKVNLVYVT